MELNYNDGGRSAAGYKGDVGDCAVRSVVIATGLSYKKVYKDFLREMKNHTGQATIKAGVYRKVFHPYLLQNGFDWIPLNFIGRPSRIKLTPEMLPRGVLVISTRKHLVCCIDGVLQDTYDSSREGTATVFGYYIKR